MYHATDMTSLHGTTGQSPNQHKQFMVLPLPLNLLRVFQRNHFLMLLIFLSSFPPSEDMIFQLTSILFSPSQCLDSTMLNQHAWNIAATFIDLDKFLLQDFIHGIICQSSSGAFILGQTWNLSKKLHDPIFRRKNFTHWKRVNRAFFSPAINSENALLTVIWPSFD